MSDSIEVRTRSVPTAAALMLMGHEPIRIIHRDHGGTLFVFAPEARETLERFAALKQKVDGMLEVVEGLR
jgi:hypothetical protein